MDGMVVDDGMKGSLHGITSYRDGWKDGKRLVGCMFVWECHLGKSMAFICTKGIFLYTFFSSNPGNVGTALFCLALARDLGIGYVIGM
jgi:hypothetical protein